jgi:hypothetical protein
MYVHIKEVFGILPISDDIHTKAAMQPYILEIQASLSSIQTRNTVCCDEHTYCRRETDFYKAHARKSSFQSGQPRSRLT